MPVTRRDFVATAAGALPLIAAAPQNAASPGGEAALDLAEWSYFWVGVERAPLARGTFAGGKQMYVEYWIPRAVKHPVPLVLVHGGGGQGTDWMALRTDGPVGPRCWCRRATKCMWSTGQAMDARLSTPIFTGRFRRRPIAWRLFRGGLRHLMPPAPTSRCPTSTFTGNGPERVRWGPTIWISLWPPRVGPM